MQQSFNESKEGNEFTPSGGQKCRECWGQPRVWSPWPRGSSCIMPAPWRERRQMVPTRLVLGRRCGQGDRQQKEKGKAGKTIQVY